MIKDVEADYKGFVISKFDFIYGLSKVIDLVNPLVTDHHQRVSYIAGAIAKEAGLKGEDLQEVILAAALHDIGVIIEKEFFELANFEDSSPGSLTHGLIGGVMLKQMDKYSNMSKLVEFHHHPWNYGKGQKTVPLYSHIIHLADRVEVSIKRDKNILDQKDGIIEKIISKESTHFAPEFVEAFINVAKCESFWFNIEEKDKYFMMRRMFQFQTIYLSEEDILDISKLISKIIDFRCCFTSTHSAGVSKTACLLAEKCNMTEKEIFKMSIAGYLHDIGKLAIPTEILYKNGMLDNSEFTRMKKHTYYTYYVLNSFDIFEDIKEWAAFHHEYLDGSGYPFKVSAERLSLGSRIMTVADIFTALTEDRPYRKGMPKERVIKILYEMVSNNKIDKNIVDIIFENYDDINTQREIQQIEALTSFENFKSKILNNTECEYSLELAARF